MITLNIEHIGPTIGKKHKQDTDHVTISVDHRSSLIWVYTVGLGLSVLKNCQITVLIFPDITKECLRSREGRISEGGVTDEQLPPRSYPQSARCLS